MIKEDFFNMPTLTVKNLSSELFQRLKQQADANHRSIDVEVVACLEKTLGFHRKSVEESIIRGRKLRELTADYSIDDKGLNEAKRSGRLSHSRDNLKALTANLSLRTLTACHSMGTE